MAHAQLAAGGASHPRRRRLAAAALRIAQSAAPLLQALGGAPAGARGAGAEERLAERVAQLERAVREAEAGGGGGGGGGAGLGKQ